MKLLDRILGRTETRAGPPEPSWAYLSGLNAPTGRLTNPTMAETLSAVTAAVDAIGGILAAQPAYTYRAIEGGRRIEERHPLMRLIRRGPNQNQTWPDFVQWLVASVLLRGNALVEIVSDRRSGALEALIPIPWEHVSVQLIGSTRRLVYDVTDINSIYGGTGQPRRLLADEVIHLKDRSDDGYLGKSRLSRAAAVVSAGLSIQEFSSSLYENGLNPTGAYKYEHSLTKVQKDQIRYQLESMFRGPRNTGKTLILEGGASWQPISITPEDAELLASRRFSVEEIARLFGVPGPIIGDLTHGTFTNSETLIRFFAVSTLSSWCRKIEAEFSRALLTDDSLSLEIDLSGLLRGDPETRWKSHEIAIRNRVLLPNEVREMEGWNPREGGDRYEPSTTIVAGGGDEG